MSNLLSFVPKKHRRRMVYLGRYEGEHRFLLLRVTSIRGAVSLKEVDEPMCTLCYRPSVEGSKWLGLGWETCPCSGDLAQVIARMDELYEG